MVLFLQKSLKPLGFCLDSLQPLWDNVHYSGVVWKAYIGSTLWKDGLAACTYNCSTFMIFISTKVQCGSQILIGEISTFVAGL